MRMKQSESLHLKKLKTKMLNTIPEVLKLPNLQEKDRLILADIFSDMVDERTPYKKRLLAFSVRQYVVDEIRQKYSQLPDTSPVVVGQYFDQSQNPPDYWDGHMF